MVWGKIKNSSGHSSGSSVSNLCQLSSVYGSISVSFFRHVPMSVTRECHVYIMSCPTSTGPEEAEKKILCPTRLTVVQCLLVWTACWHSTIGLPVSISFFLQINFYFDLKFVLDIISNGKLTKQSDDPIPCQSVKINCSKLITLFAMWETALSLARTY